MDGNLGLDPSNFGGRDSGPSTKRGGLSELGYRRRSWETTAMKYLPTYGNGILNLNSTQIDLSLSQAIIIQPYHIVSRSSYSHAGVCCRHEHSRTPDGCILFLFLITYI